MSTIADRYERGKSDDFYRFLCIVKGCCAEVRSLFDAAWDAQYLEQEDFVRLVNQSGEVGRVIGELRASYSANGNDNPKLITRHSSL